MKKSLTTLFAGALLAGFAVSRAALIAYDGFESYTAGSNMPDRGSVGEFNGGTGWSNAWDEDAVSGGDVSVVSKTMSYTGGTVSVSGGATAMQLKSTNTHMALRSYTSRSDTVYLSYLFETNDSGEFFQQWNSNDEIFANTGTDTDTASVMQRLDGSSNPRFGARINSLSQEYDSSPLVSNNTTYFLVARISKDGQSYYNKMDIMINPTSTTEPAGTWDISSTINTDTGLDTLQSLGFRLNGVESSDSFYIDEIRVGSSFDAVVIPEPSTILLVGGALVALVLFRRRR